MTTAPNRAKLTKSYVDKIAPGPKDEFHWDAEVKGFGLRITPRGKVTFIVQGRVDGSEAAVRITIGAYGVFTVDEARDDAREHLRSMRRGIDPRDARKADEAMRVTLQQVCDAYVARPGKLKKTSKHAIERHVTACGANLANVIEIEGVSHEGKRNTFSMQDDLEAVSEWLRFAEEEGRPFAMLVIDPVTSYLPGQKLRKVDMNDAGHLRSILEPWLKLAQTHNIAIVCVTHFAKDVTRSMLHRVLGSAAFTQTCRSLCAVIQRPTPRDEEPEPHAKAFMQVKVNLPEHPGGAWKFSTEKVEVGTDPRNGRVITATRPMWEGLDGGLTPESVMGGTRGPVSKYEATFGMWLSAQFIGHPPGHWLRVDQVKTAATIDKACTDRWWNEHSGTFMEKQNLQGFWFCRPRQGKGETT